MSAKTPETAIVDNSKRILELQVELSKTPATSARFNEILAEMAKIRNVQPSNQSRTKYTRLYQMPEYASMKLPTWVWRLQDLETWQCQKQAKALGYDAKVLEVYRKDNGFITVIFDTKDMLWKVMVTTTEGYKKQDINKQLLEGYKVFNKTDEESIRANKSLISSEKRHCIAVARVLSAGYKLAFAESKDVVNPNDNSVLTSQDRRLKAYKPYIQG